MHTPGVFGYLAARFSVHPENLATEALNYVLGQSEIARQAFTDYLIHFNAELPNNLFYTTQVFGEDTTIPDLVGSTPEGHQVAIIENKFWAGLTPNQPNGYLKRLPINQAGILLFIVPEKRLVLVWNELLRRLSPKRIDRQKEENNFSKKIWVNKLHSLAICSWDSILNYMLQKMEVAGDHQIASDIRQILSLCNRMDQDAFLPLNSEELSSNETGKRILQYGQLVDEVVEILISEGFASTKGMRAAGGSGWYGRYHRLTGNGCLLYFSAEHWGKLAATPIWLRVKDNRWKVTEDLLRSLAPLELSQPTRLFRVFGGVYIPIYLPVGVEKPDVVESILDQMHEIAALLPKEM